MSSRHRARERAIQILYLRDMREQTVEESIDTYYASVADNDEDRGLPERDPFTEELVTGVAPKTKEIDARIARHSKNWRLERMAPVDRNILRLAVYEMSFTRTPAPVAIDEAILLAQRFSGDQSVAFINGILDAIRREYTQPKSAPESSDANE